MVLELRRFPHEILALPRRERMFIQAAMMWRNEKK